MIEFYAYDSPNGRKISVALEEMELPYEVHVVDITKDEQHHPGFLQLNPNGRTPAIRDLEGPDARPITVFESGAILIYLAEKSGRFLPRDLRERMSVIQWLMFQMAGFGPIPGQVHHFLGRKDEPDNAYALARFKTETRRLYGVMDKRLSDVEYFAGDLSIADFAVLGWAWRHQRHQVDLQDFPNVRRWYEGLMARPRVKRGFATALS